MTRWRGLTGTGSTDATAQRLKVQPWRDPRLLLGLLLVLGATLLGARVLAAPDDTVAYWSVNQEVRAGERVADAQLAQTHLRLSDSVAETYLRVEDGVSLEQDSVRWARDLAPGSLIDPSALVDADQRERTELPLNVENGSLPHDLRTGETVDVWVSAGPGDQRIDAVRVLERVRVVSISEQSAGLSLSRTVLVDAGATKLAGETIGTLATGHVILVRRV